jgi:hypothetical protein
MTKPVDFYKLEVGDICVVMLNMNGDGILHRVPLRVLKLSFRRDELDYHECISPCFSTLVSVANDCTFVRATGKEIAKLKTKGI